MVMKSKTEKEDRGFGLLQKEVIDPDLCCRCGTCVAVCPEDNIHFPDPTGKCLPADKGTCRDGCALCSRACPGADSDMSRFCEQAPGDRDPGFGLGPYREICLLKAADPAIRAKSTSGGAVTALLTYCLEHRIVDGVLSVGPDPGDPRRSAARISHSAEELLQCIQSRYCVVPLNAALRQLNPDKKYAMAGLPCQVEGLMKLRKRSPVLVENVSLVLGLFCHSTMYFEATERLLESAAGNGHTRLSAVKYRDGDFPGHFTVHRENGSEKIAHLDQLMVYFDFFSLNRCRLCMDHVAALADISFADPFPFLRELAENDRKWTAVVARTEKGSSLLEAALADGEYLTRREVRDNHVRDWDRGLHSKQWMHLLQVASDRRLGLAVPDFHAPLPPIGLIKALINAAKARVFFNITLGSVEMLKNAMCRDSRMKTLKQFRRWRRKRNRCRVNNIEGGAG